MGMATHTMRAIRVTTSIDPVHTADHQIASGIDQVESSRSSRSSRWSIPILSAILALGVLLVGLSLPRLLGAVYAQPANAVLLAIRTGHNVSDADLEGGAEALARSTQFSGTPAYVLSDLALLKLLRVQSGGGLSASESEERRAYALDAQTRALERAPAGASGWGRLAYAHALRDGLNDPSRAALAMSLRAGGFDLELMAFRLQLMLAEWDSLGPLLREAVPGEIIQLTRHSGEGYDALAEIYLTSPHAEVIERVVSESPTRRARFAKSLELVLGEH
jgi:hypothetical protein